MMAALPCFVSCYRVSTDKQGRFGLGLEAQRAAVQAHVAGSRGQVVAEFVEVESGRRCDRPQLAAALAAARAHRAVLVIAKLDRLARNVHFVSGLMESGVEFVVADMPKVNRLTVHILAAVTEEARMISARTKAALAAAKARGVRLGNPNLHAGSPDQARAANAVKTGRAQMRVADVLPFIEQARRAGATTLQQLADALGARGVPTPSGRGQRWHPVQVARIVGRHRTATGTSAVALAESAV